MASTLTNYLIIVYNISRPILSERNSAIYVAGYTICNDVSARDLQMQTGQWMAGKAIDTFAPIGPGIVLAAYISDPQALS